MANCYKCRTYIRRGEGYRRWVNTGQSISFGRSISIRGYSGLRTLCADCAKSLDNSARVSNGCCLGCFGTIGLIVFLGIKSDKHSSSTIPNNVLVTAPLHSVTYRITAQAQYVNSLKYMDETGHLQLINKAKVPWTMTFNAPLGNPLYVGARSANPERHVWADIYVDGKHISGLKSRKDTGEVGVGGSLSQRRR